MKRIFNQRIEHGFEIRETSGNYRSVREEEILATALAIIHGRFVKGTVISAPQEAHDFLRLELAQLPYEVFAVLWLDARRRMIAFETVFKGTIDQVRVYPRELVRAALAYDAAACILCHHRPAGLIEPSQDERKIIDSIREALALIEVKTMDHIVIGETAYPFAEHGLI